MILGAALFDAAIAERYGWINRALPDAELDSFVSALARRIARRSFDQILAVKTAVDAGTASPLPALLAQNRELGALFFAPETVTLSRNALAAGAQTREGERDLEELLAKLPR